MGVLYLIQLMHAVILYALIADVRVECLPPCIRHGYVHAVDQKCAYVLMKSEPITRLLAITRLFFDGKIEFQLYFFEAYGRSICQNPTNIS